MDHDLLCKRREHVGGVNSVVTEPINSDEVPGAYLQSVRVEATNEAGCALRQIKGAL
jgi:hypothetical protein